LVLLYWYIYIYIYMCVCVCVCVRVCARAICTQMRSSNFGFIENRYRRGRTAVCVTCTCKQFNSLEVKNALIRRAWFEVPSRKLLVGPGVHRHVGSLASGLRIEPMMSCKQSLRWGKLRRSEVRVSLGVVKSSDWQAESEVDKVWSAGLGEGSSIHVPCCDELKGKLYRTFLILHKICLCVVFC
jgi:hypothetical protein